MPRVPMRSSLLRPLLIVEFLIAIDAVFTLWSEVGGQYDLDLMFWPWKLALGLGAAALVVAITSTLVRNGGAVTRRVLLLCSLLITVALIAGVVTYYYYLNEPSQDDDEGTSITRTVTIPGRNSPRAPSACRPCS